MNMFLIGYSKKVQAAVAPRAAMQVRDLTVKLRQYYIIISLTSFLQLDSCEMVPLEVY